MLIGGNMGRAQSTDRTITVTAYPLWTDTGITLQPTDSVRIHGATGQWTFNRDHGVFNGPEGVPYNDTYNVWLTDGRLGDLIGFIGNTPYGIAQNDPRVFAIGSGSVSLSDKSGKLWLGFNDDFVTGWCDNLESITVEVSTGCQVTSIPAFDWKQFRPWEVNKYDNMYVSDT